MIAVPQTHMGSIYSQHTHTHTHTHSDIGQPYSPRGCTSRCFRAFAFAYTPALEHTHHITPYTHTHTHIHTTGIHTHRASTHTHTHTHKQTNKQHTRNSRLTHTRPLVCYPHTKTTHTHTHTHTSTLTTHITARNVCAVVCCVYSGVNTIVFSNCLPFAESRSFNTSRCSRIYVE